MRLENKVTIVTGGASGIGRAIARRFADEGAVVVIADTRRDPREGGPNTDDLIRESGGRVVFHQLDVSQWEQVDSLVGETVREFGSLDVMVNNAAVSLGIPLLDTTEELWDRVMGINLKGVFFGCKRAIQQMLQQEIKAEARGRIINISSQHGMIGAPEDFAYGVSKAGIAQITRQVATDYAKDYIVCNAIAPGKIVTGKGGRGAEPRWMEYSRQRTPMPRLGEPRDVANAAVFLASDEATYIAGVNLMVDGGWMAS